jgi:hypothetical protein
MTTLITRAAALESNLMIIRRSKELYMSRLQDQFDIALLEAGVVDINNSNYTDQQLEVWTSIIHNINGT